MEFGAFTIRAGMDGPMVSRRDGCCLALQIAENEFYLVASGCVLEITSNDPEKPHVELLSLEEGRFADGKWERRRRLNGDEAFVLAYGKPALLRLKVFAYR